MMKKLSKITLLAAATAFLLAGVTACFTSTSDVDEDSSDLGSPGSGTTYTLTPAIVGSYSETPAENSYSTTAYGEIFYFANSVTCDGTNIKTNGKLQGKKSHIKFTTTGPATVEINFKSGSSSSARHAAWATISGSSLGTETAGTVASTDSYVSEKFSLPAAGTYAIGASSSDSNAGSITIASLKVTF